MSLVRLNLLMKSDILVKYIDIWRLVHYIKVAQSIAQGSFLRLLEGWVVLKLAQSIARKGG